jgi:hypothetical protein
MLILPRGIKTFNDLCTLLDVYYVLLLDLDIIQNT